MAPRWAPRWPVNSSPTVCEPLALTRPSALPRWANRFLLERQTVSRVAVGRHKVPHRASPWHRINRPPVSPQEPLRNGVQCHLPKLPQRLVPMLVGRSLPLLPPRLPSRATRLHPKGKRTRKILGRYVFYCLIYVVPFLLNIFLAPFKEGECRRQRQYRGHTLRSGASAFDTNYSSTPKLVQQTRGECNNSCSSTANVCTCTSAYGATTTAATAARPAAAV